MLHVCVCVVDEVMDVTCVCVCRDEVMDVTCHELMDVTCVS